MRRGRPLVWTVIGCVVAAVAVLAVVVVQANSGSSSNAASSSAPPTSPGASTHATEPTPVVTPETSGTYLSDLKPTGGLGELVNHGPVKISGSIYPKSISFYCNVGDPTAFPAYILKHNARRFHATIGLAAKLPTGFQAGILLVGDGRTLRMFSVTAKPTTVDVDVRGVHSLKLECFGSGTTATAGFAIPVAWGNARVSGGR